METVHCIGDSHVSVFVGKDIISSGLPCPEDCHPPFRTYRIGPYLAYSLGHPGHIAITLIRDVLGRVPVSDPIMLSFGEIDCRVHIVMQSKIQGKSIEELSREVADRYAGLVNKLISEGRQVFLYAPPPTCNHFNPEAAVSKENEYPHIGTTQERNRATYALTQRLKEHFPFGIVVDVFSRLVNENMTSKGEYFMDGIHLSQKALPIILEEFDRVMRESIQGTNDYILSLHPY